MRILEGSRMQAGELAVSARHEDGRDWLDLHASGVQGLECLFVSVPHPEGMRLGLEDAGSLAGLSPVMLSVDSGPALEFGWVATDEPFSGSGLLASFAMSPLADADAAPGVRAASKAVPPVKEIERNARWNIISWYYTNPGDYDQNGVVTIADLTPLGQNFGASGPFDPASAQWMVDGDGNGEINISDISVIAQHFGNTVTGYDLYASPDGAGHPDSSGARAIGSLQLADADGGPGERKRFQLTDSAVLFNDRYWVVEQAGGSVGELTAEWNGSWHASRIHSIGGSYNQSIGSMIVSDGLPMVFFEADPGGNSQVLFSRGTNAHGDDWTEPIVVSGVEVNCTYPLAGIVDGRPAFTFGNLSSGDTLFRIAADAGAGSWGSVRVVSGFGYFPETINGLDGRAIIGGSIDSLTSFISFPDHSFFEFDEEMAPVGSSFISLQGDEIFHLLYTQDSNGFSYIRNFTYEFPLLNKGTPVLVSGDSNHTAVDLLRGPDGRMHALLRRNASDDVLLSSAGDLQGETWTLPGTVTSVNPSTLAATFAYGRIWACHYDGSQHRIRLSQEELIQPWQDFGPVSTLDQPGGRALIGTVRGHPAVVHTVDTGLDEELWFAIWY